MKAAVYTEPGPSSVLRVVERDMPEPGVGEVRVRVVNSGVNPTDWKFRAFTRQPFAEVVPGQDAAGYVDAVGEGVDAVAAGDRVWLMLAQNGRAGGATAQYTVQPADHVFHLPACADFEVGASLGVPAVTAHRALTCAQDGPTRLSPGALSGKVVLVAGGAGAVGNAAIQLARWAGATVIATVSSDRKWGLATAAGAHHVVNYRTADAAEAIRELVPGGIDIVVEVAPAQNHELDLAVIRNHGTIAVYANNGGNEFTVDVYRTFWRNVRYQFVLLYPLAADLLQAAAADINDAVASGAFRVGEQAGLPLHHFPLHEVAAAHDHVEGGAVGKVLLDIGVPIESATGCVR